MAIGDDVIYPRKARHSRGLGYLAAKKREMFGNMDMFLHLSIMQNIHVSKHHMALHKYGHFMFKLDKKEKLEK